MKNNLALKIYSSAFQNTTFIQDFHTYRSQCSFSSTSSPSGSYPERVESSTPATITAERYPDMHPAWDGPTQGRPDEMIPSTPSSLSRPTPSLWARYGRTLLIGVVVFFSLVCVILVGLILR